MIIEIDPKKSLEENASLFFEKAKRFKVKAERAKDALIDIEKKKREIEKKIEKIKKSEEKEIEKIMEKREKRLKKKWFHGYRWFITSNGFLVVAGKDASSNESLIKKHLDSNDLVLHCELIGSPFVVIKNGKTASDMDIRETADFAVTFSRAWKEGIYSYKVAIINPDQLSKTPNSGEYLSKGAFIIRGKTRSIDGNLNLCLGVKDKEVMSGPRSAIEKHCEKYVCLIPGKIDKSIIARQLRKKLNVAIEDILRALPAGGFEEKREILKNKKE